MEYCHCVAPLRMPTIGGGLHIEHVPSFYIILFDNNYNCKIQLQLIKRVLNRKKYELSGNRTQV